MQNYTDSIHRVAECTLRGHFATWYTFLNTFFCSIIACIISLETYDKIKFRTHKTISSLRMTNYCVSNFLAVDWQRFATFMARVSLVSCLATSIPTLVLNYPVWPAAWNGIVCIILTVIETEIFQKLPVAQKIKKFLLDSWQFKVPAVKGFLYYFLSVPLYVVFTPCLVTAILLNITTALEFFTQCNRFVDEQEASTTSSQQPALKKIQKEPLVSETNQQQNHVTIR